jgi:hypothetical protein
LLAFGFFVSPVTTRPETQGQLFFSLGKSDKPKYQTRAVSFAGAGERRQRTLELQFALPPVATRNGLASPLRIGAPTNRRKHEILLRLPTNCPTQPLFFNILFDLEHISIPTSY